MGKFDESLENFEAVNRQAWRDWLQQNHQSSRGIWLIYYKVKSGKPSVRYQEAVQEALCFGWIDSKVQSLDEERYKQIFTPRKPNSVWSKLNKQYVLELIEQNLRNALDEVEALIIPDDLQRSLNQNPTASKNFEAFSNSTKKGILFWISSAKRPQTRAKRIQKTIDYTTDNKNPLG
ncbi:MAG: YdeI/OmpD-associated family protein [Xenococcaceae cyanobacterium MO_207.B15]|nr:YdeI/OmpD-associated family protein [Xenococcaceae cyanobacterium MO_207.B15]